MRPVLLLPLALLPLLTSCSDGPKKVEYQLNIQLALSQPLPGKAGEPLPPEFADWFTPFNDDAVCPGVRVYPSVEGLRLDQVPVAPLGLTALDPKAMANEQVSGVQSLLGVKPKFDKMREAAEAQIKAIPLPAKMTQPGNSQAADAELKRQLARKPALALVGASDAGAATARLNQLKPATSPANPAEAMQAVSTPSEMRAAILKALCAPMQKKDKGKTLLLVDAGLFSPAPVADSGGDVLPPPVAEGPAPQATPTHPVADASKAQQALDRALQFLELARADDGMRKDRRQRALSELDAAIAADPNLALAYLNRGSLYRQMGDLGRAEGDLKQAAQQMPGKPGPHVELAIVLAGRKDTQGALNELDQAFAAGFKMIDELRREPALKAVVAQPGFETLLVRHGFK